jgi:hypothetical protein
MEKRSVRFHSTNPKGLKRISKLVQLLESYLGILNQLFLT